MTLEIDLFGDGTWLRVTEDVFMAFTGRRRLNGFTYIGPIWPLGSKK